MAIVLATCCSMAKVFSQVAVTFSRMPWHVKAIRASATLHRLSATETGEMCCILAGALTGCLLVASVGFGSIDFVLPSALCCRQSIYTKAKARASGSGHAYLPLSLSHSPTPPLSLSLSQPCCICHLACSRKCFKVSMQLWLAFKSLATFALHASGMLAQ